MKKYVRSLEQYLAARKEQQEQYENDMPMSEIMQIVQIKISDEDGETFLPTEKQLQEWKAEQQERMRNLYKI